MLQWEYHKTTQIFAHQNIVRRRFFHRSAHDDIQSILEWSELGRNALPTFSAHQYDIALK